MQTRFEKRLQVLQTAHKELINEENKKLESTNGIYNRYINPILTINHIPISWRYDLNYETNPYLMERLGIHSIIVAGAIRLNERYLVIVSVEGKDGNHYNAVAESKNGIDNYEFWDYPVIIPGTTEPGFDLYSIHIVKHDDGWIYGIFRFKKQDAQSVQCGIARTTDLKSWERLPDLKVAAAIQHHIVLHTELINGKYAFYTRPAYNSIEMGRDGKIEFQLSDTIINARIAEEIRIDKNVTYQDYESKVGLSPSPIKTQYGWLHLAHGVKTTAQGLRYVLYMFMTDLKNINSVIYKPEGYIVIRKEDKKIAAVSNDLFSNGWILGEDNIIYIYYAFSGMRIEVASSTLDQLLDYVMNTTSEASNTAVYRLIDNNKALMNLNQTNKKKTIK